MSYSSEPDSDSIKMFIGQISRNMDEEDLKKFLEEYGSVYQVTILRDKMTGDSRGCGFVTYFTRKDALTAQMALHNLKVMPGLSHPIQMKPADVQRNPLDERRLFVGMLSKKMTEVDVSAIFSPFGKIDDCVIMKDLHGQGESKGCAFVTFASKDSAEEAIRTLHNSRTLEGCKSPIVVKFADTQKEKDLKKFFHKPQGQQMGNSFSSGFGQQQQQYYPSFAQQSMPNNNSGLGDFGNQNNNAQIQQLLLAAIATSPILQAIPGGLGGLLGNANLGNLLSSPMLNNNMSANATPALQSAQTAPMLALLQQLSAGNQSSGANNSGFAGGATNSSGYGTSSPNSFGQGGYSSLSEPSFGNNSMSGMGSMSGMASMSTADQSSSYSAGNDLMSKAYAGIQQYIAGLPNAALAMNAATSGNQSKGPDGANLFIYHIPMEFRDCDLLQMFMPFGRVLSASVFLDKKTGQSKCFGFVSYENASSAQSAIQAMNGFQIGSKRLKVSLKNAKSEGKPY